MKTAFKAIFEGLKNEHAGKKLGALAHVDYEKALTYLKWLIQQKQEIKRGIDL